MTDITMVKPILNKPYTPWHATDVRESFELERKRLQAARSDLAAKLDTEFGKALGLALQLAAASCPRPSRPATKEVA